MVRETFDTTKQSFGFPDVLCAGWVGTIKHCRKNDGVERAEQRHSCCCLMSPIVEVTKNMAHTKKDTRHIAHLIFRIQSEVVNNNTWKWQ